MLALRLHRRDHLVLDAALRRRGPRIILASLAMGGALWFAGRAMEPYLHTTLLIETLLLSALVLGGILLYVALALALGAVNLAGLRALIGRSS